MRPRQRDRAELRLTAIDSRRIGSRDTEYRVTVVRPGAGTPTGAVSVTDGVDRCTATVAAGGCTIRLRTIGSRALTAGYAGNSNFRGSTSGRASHTVRPPLAHVLGAAQTHRRFRVSREPGLAQISCRRAPIGTAFTFSLDRPATVRLDFTQPGAGREVRNRCVARRKRNQHKPECTVLPGALTFSGHAGVNTVRFNGWLSQTKKLRPGRYRLVITAITPAVGLTSQQLRFKIVR